MAVSMALLVGASALAAQPPGGRPVASAADTTLPEMEAYVRTHLALNVLRDREQAELAEGRHKKAESQSELRDKYRIDRAKVLAQYGMSAAQFARLTQRVSSNDSVRRVFETTLARMSAAK